MMTWWQVIASSCAQSKRLENYEALRDWRNFCVGVCVRDQINRDESIKTEKKIKNWIKNLPWTNFHTGLDEQLVLNMVLNMVAMNEKITSSKKSKNEHI